MGIFYPESKKAFKKLMDYNLKALFRTGYLKEDILHTLMQVFEELSNLM